MNKDELAFLFVGKEKVVEQLQVSGPSPHLEEVEEKHKEGEEDHQQEQ